MKIYPASFFLLGVILFIPSLAFSLEAPSRLEDCATILDDRWRLACYDRLTDGRVSETGGKPNNDSVDDASAAVQKPAPPLATSSEKKAAFSFARHWELTPEHKRGTFMFSPHNSNYILFANHSSSPNNTPSSPTAGAAQNENLASTEVRFQLSFKMKLFEDVANLPIDLWFGYTQETNWQFYNRKSSSPVRESDYQPELMLVMPINFNVLGMRARFVNLGLVHQSNGRSEPLSRSWNRVYAQLGLERDKFTLTGRVWKRVAESRSDDDNPDITDYTGHGDVVLTYRMGEQVFSLLGRKNFNTGRGAAELGWEFPLVKNLKGYVEAFSGYGHSLIDYNHTQTTIGLGLLFNF